MTDEEEEAIEQLKRWREFIIKNKEKVNKANAIEFYLRTALNLIQKQQEELKKKDKIIDEMIQVIDMLNNSDNIEKDCFVPREFSDIDNCIKTTCEECIKQYFERKAET